MSTLGNAPPTDSPGLPGLGSSGVLLALAEVDILLQALAPPTSPSATEALVDVVRGLLADIERHATHPGFLCEQCLDAPATQTCAAPWGGEMGVCAACAQA